MNSERHAPPATSPVVLSFIVPVLNDAHGLRRCLESIRSQRGENVEIVVADNGSVDSSAQVAREFDAVVLCLPSDSIAAVRNRAARVARGHLLAFIDADMQLAPGWSAAALRHFERPGVDAVGADYSAPPGANWIQRLYDGFREHQPGVNEARWLASGNLVVRRSAFERVGGFDETLQTCEDWDLCVRLRQQGGRVLTDSNVASVHFGDPTTLRQLFFGELWRGGDNLRVSLRGPVLLRDLPSIVIPILCLACAGGCTLWAAAALAFDARLLLGVPATLGLGLLPSALRAIRLWRRTHVRTHTTLSAALLVAVTYDAARAAALIVRIPHRRARSRAVLTEKSA